MSKEKYTQSQDKIELLDANIEMFKRCIAACEEIKSGATETSVCDKYNIDRMFFRRIIFEKKLGFDYKPIDMPPDKEKDLRVYREYWRQRWADYCWQEKLFCEVFGEYNYNNIPPNIEESVDYVLNTFSEMERDIIKLYFEDGWSFGQIAEKYNITRERPRQIERRVLRKLRHPKCSDILKYGVDVIADIDRAKQENIQKQEEYREYHKEKIAFLKNAFDDAIKMKSEKDLKQCIAQANAIIGNKKECPIEELDLSVRTYNRIRHAGYRTIADFENVSIEQLSKIRNMGKISLDELVTKLSSYGVVISTGGEV